jgi:hemerythrin-like domain-containing protein
MMPVGPLMIEHRLILRMTKVLDRIHEECEGERRVGLSEVGAAVDFIRTYADRCHHGKEEDILFRRCREKTLTPELAQTMQLLLDEHVQGRALVAQFEAAAARHGQGEGSALDEIGELAARISAFYQTHIETEDQRFFVAVMDSFSKPERDAMFREGLLHDQSFDLERYRELVETMEGP